MPQMPMGSDMPFQSTLPARGATSICTQGTGGNDNFNPRSPHGERQSCPFPPCATVCISIHAPRTGSDGIVTSMITWIIPFQSTLPARGATPPPCGVLLPDAISIHAPRTGSDDFARDSLIIFEISIHAPRTGSDCRRDPPKYLQDISIHAPRTGSDISGTPYKQTSDISIHAPRTGSDSVRWLIFRCTTYFNPRSPHGERR